MGLFSKKSNSEPQAEQASQQEAAQAAKPLPTQGPLRNLINRLLADGAQGGKLSLVQRGNTMNQQTERNVNGSVDTDSGVVDQNHPMFDDVAALYTESMSQESGAWRTVIITAQQGTVMVDYAYPSGPNRTETYQVNGGAAGQPAQGGQSGQGVQDGTATREDAASQQVGTSQQPGTSEAANAEQQTNADQQRAGQSADNAGAWQAAGQNASAGQNVGSADQQGQTGGQNLQSAGQTPQGADQDAAADGRASGTGVAAAGVGGGALAAAAAQGREEEGRTAQNPNRSADDHQRSTDREPVRDQRDQSADTHSAQGQQVDGDTGNQDTRRSEFQDLPDHVDHDEWRDDNAGRSGGQVTGAAAAGAAAGAGARSGGGNDADAPSVARGADVAPSYRAGEAAGTAPSQDRLAEGNKVLSEADVLSRVAGVQKRLFGPEGTARDVSTVLIRVRTLGSYYDALTHVRQGGFWDQRGTFDLVPEEELKVQELKDDSYVEGEGAPLAVMFRFRPGIPPEVSFDYSDEEAFVRYEERLPSQNYVEELRMYPRTGANIPQHMNDALQDWNY
ncbi:MULTISPECIES: hypothetical protein [Kocuria]|uniref:Uncharacterized protein n=1 Tax=Kocuria subflava TaxID=1736139 RepID=A0A846TTI5_9MICC|nr:MULTISPECIES: hypothetical protein [Kocuria]NKE09084.1 hypothetical protein [Kocuria subflava]